MKTNEELTADLCSENPQAIADALVTALALPDDDYQEFLSNLDEVLKPRTLEQREQ